MILINVNLQRKYIISDLCVAEQARQLYVLIPLPQQTVTVSLMFLADVSYILGVSMETFIPRCGILRYLNPVNQFPSSDTSF
jgi:hypothetical protein